MDIRPRRLVVLGSILIDVTVWVGRWPDRGGDVLARDGKALVGGAFNVIATARRLGLATIYGGLIGHGVFGDRVRQALRELDVPALLDPSPSDRGDTGFDIAVVEADGERTFVTAPGAEACLEPADLARLRFRAGDSVYLSGYDLLYSGSGPTLETLGVALPPDASLVLDPGPLAAEIPTRRLGAIFNRLNLLTLNLREGTLLTRETDPTNVMAVLLGRLSPACRVVLRLGPEGALVGGCDDPLRRVPVRRVTACDTTGAGDVHTAVLLARLAEGQPFYGAVRDANAAASWAVERPGPSRGPSREVLQQLLAGEP